MAQKGSAGGYFKAGISLQPGVEVITVTAGFCRNNSVVTTL